MFTAVACGAPSKYDELDSVDFVSVGDASGAETLDAVALGADGSAYLVGTVDSFDVPGNVFGESYTSVNGGIYFAKLDAAGNPLWTHVIVAPMRDETTTPFVTGVALDGDDNVIVTGYIDSHFDLGDGLPQVPDWTNEDASTFVAKYTSDGDIMWSRRFWGSTRYGWPGAPKVDPSGNIVFLAYEQWGVDFGEGPVSESYQTTLVKLDADGELVYARPLGEPYDGTYHSMVVTAFTHTTAGEVAFVALIKGILDVGDGTLVGTDNHWSEVLAHVSATGEIKDARSIARDTDIGRATGMAVADGGDFIIGGYRFDPEYQDLDEGFVERIAADGSRRWRREVDTFSGVWPEKPDPSYGIGSFTVDGSNRPVFATVDGVISYDLDGNVRWRYRQALAARVAARGNNIAVFGSGSGGIDFAGHSFQLDSDLWPRGDGYLLRFTAE